MKNIVLYRKEKNKMTFKVTTKSLNSLISKKIKKDINISESSRLNGDMGTPIDEVLSNIQKIIKGESL